MDKAPQNCQSKHRIKYHKIGHNHIRGTADSPKGPMWSYFHHSEYILYSVKLRIKSTILTVNQVAMCYLALPFTSQYFIQTPIAIASKSVHVMCMHWGSSKDTSEFEKLKLLLLFTRFLNGYQCNYKIHAAVKAMYGRHTACSVFYLERREQTTGLHFYIHSM